MPTKYELNTAVYRYLYRCRVEEDLDELSRAGLQESRYHVLEHESYWTGSSKFRQAPAVTADISIDWSALPAQAEANPSCQPLTARLRLLVLEIASIYQQLLSSLDFEQMARHGVLYDDLQQISSSTLKPIHPTAREVKIRLSIDTSLALHTRRRIQRSCDNAMQILHFIRNQGTGQMLQDLFGLDQHDFMHARKICERVRRGRFRSLSAEQEQKLDQRLMLACHARNGLHETFRMPTQQDYLNFQEQDPDTPYWQYYERANKLYSYYKQIAGRASSRRRHA